MKRAGIYDPYLHILGGAERYVLSIANCLIPEYKVVFYSDNEQLLRQAEIKFGIKLENFEVKSWELVRNKRRKELKNLDLFFYVTDGSLFITNAKKNYLIVQTPDHIPALTLLNQVKILSWQKIICYSRFMRYFIRKRFFHDGEILFVPIKLPRAIEKKKSNLIVSVGRFFTHLHSKKQKEMVEIFKEMVDEGLKNTELVLIGSVDPGGEGYLEGVKKLAKNYPIKILTDISYQELTKYYSQAKIYWHATGFTEDIESYPARAEHFGVSTLEAMSHGAVPVVLSAGGQVEIVEHSKDGFRFITKEEMKSYTQKLLKDQKLWQKMSQVSIEKSKNYTQDKFCQRLREIIT